MRPSLNRLRWAQPTQHAQRTLDMLWRWCLPLWLISGPHKILATVLGPKVGWSNLPPFWDQKLAG
eukprot:11963893-Karenia_brevis.AAC.1